MLEELKLNVFHANLDLPRHQLVMLTWGNVSAIDGTRQYMVIKPSGMEYGEMAPEDMVVVDMDGRVVEGRLRPSSDTPTHLALYKNFPQIGGVVHTHSTYSTAYAQAGMPLNCFGTTHADYFYGDVPCTRMLTDSEIRADYEWETGKVIVETFQKGKYDYNATPAVLVNRHGPFCWGKNAHKAVENAVVLEECARMAILSRSLNPGSAPAPNHLMDKHYFRKHGANAYYGQKKEID